MLDVDQAAAARELIAAEREAVRDVQDRLQKRAARTGTVAAVCEECGKGSDWPAAEAGHTDNCPHCGAYLDIPDPDGEDDWSGVDFGAEGAEDEPGTEKP